MPKRAVNTGTFFIKNPIVLNLSSTKPTLLQVSCCKDTYNIQLLKIKQISLCGFVHENIHTNLVTVVHEQ